MQLEWQAHVDDPCFLVGSHPLAVMSDERTNNLAAIADSSYKSQPTRPCVVRLGVDCYLHLENYMLSAKYFNFSLNCVFQLLFSCQTLARDPHDRPHRQPLRLT